MTICSQKASSALFLWMVLAQQMIGSCLASPIATNHGDQNTVGEGNGAGEVTSIPSTTTTEPPPTAFSFEVYPEYQKLMHKAYTSGMYQKLRGGRMALPDSISWNPTALWNSTATNKTTACQQYLRENDMDHPSAGSCAASYVCNITENLHRFPAVLVHAKCGGSESKCIDSYHAGPGYVDGSRGSCQAQHHVRIKVLVFRPSEVKTSSHNSPTTAAEEVASIQKSETGSGAPETTLKQLKGEWNWSYEYVPLDCQCMAK